MAQCEILAIDDNEAQANILKEMLRHAGYQAEALTDSTQAMDLIRKIRPKVILLDVMMPGVDGFTLCKMIKNDPELKSTKVIFYTAKVFPVDKKTGMAIGADAYITKPAKAETILQQIQASLKAG